MSLTQRKPRPLIRHAESMRDDRLFIVACDDTYAPKQYFEFFRIPRVQIHVVSTTDGTSAAGSVLRRLLEVEHDDDDERWMLLDTDHYIHGNHLPSFVDSIAKARQNGIQVALSRPCFELWLLLHHETESAVGSLVSVKEVESSLRAKLGEYNKASLKAAHYPYRSVVEASARAARLDGRVPGGEIPQANTSRVYKIWQSIVANAHPSQIPEELRGLLP